MKRGHICIFYPQCVPSASPVSAAVPGTEWVFTKYCLGSMQASIASGALKEGRMMRMWIFFQLGSDAWRMSRTGHNRKEKCILGCLSTAVEVESTGQTRPRKYDFSPRVAMCLPVYLPIKRVSFFGLHLTCWLCPNLSWCLAPSTRPVAIMPFGTDQEAQDYTWSLGRALACQ